MVGMRHRSTGVHKVRFGATRPRDLVLTIVLHPAGTEVPMMTQCRVSMRDDPMSAMIVPLRTSCPTAYAGRARLANERGRVGWKFTGGVPGGNWQSHAWRDGDAAGRSALLARGGGRVRCGSTPIPIAPDSSPLQTGALQLALPWLEDLPSSPGAMAMPNPDQPVLPGSGSGC